MQHIQEMVIRLLEPDVLNDLKWGIIVLLYVVGRITKAQFIAEQKGANKLLELGETKRDVAIQQVTSPITFAFDILDKVPVVNTKMPVINMSIPGIAKSLIQFPVGMLSDILHNAPVIGSKVDK